MKVISNLLNPLKLFTTIKFSTLIVSLDIILDVSAFGSE